MTVLAKIRRHPPLEGWEFRLAEVHFAQHRALLLTEPGPGRLPVMGGKVIISFGLQREDIHYYINEREADERIASRGKIHGYRHYRLAFRDVASDATRRTLVATIVPPHHLCTHHVAVESDPSKRSPSTRLYLLALLNSFVVDYALRSQMAGSRVLSALRRLHIPDLQRSRPGTTDAISKRAAELLSTSSDYHPLIAPIALPKKPPTASAQARLRAELDGMFAYVVGLTEDEFSEVLGSFPLVPEPTRVAARNAYRDMERGLLSV